MLRVCVCDLCLSLSLRVFFPICERFRDTNPLFAMSFESRSISSFFLLFFSLSLFLSSAFASESDHKVIVVPSFCKPPLFFLRSALWFLNWDLDLHEVWVFCWYWSMARTEFESLSFRFCFFSLYAWNCVLGLFENGMVGCLCVRSQLGFCVCSLLSILCLWLCTNAEEKKRGGGQCLAFSLFIWFNLTYYSTFSSILNWWS